MSFVWIKTICGCRTAGYFTFSWQGDLYRDDGSIIILPPGTVTLQDDDLINNIKTSSIKGVYQVAWTTSRIGMQQLCLRHGAMALFEMMEATFSFIQSNALKSPHHMTKKEIEQRAEERRKSDELSYKSFVTDTTEALDLFKTITVGNFVFQHTRASTDHCHPHTELQGAQILQ